MEKIYVLHENGAKSHYKGLEYLCKQNNIKVEYREFSIIKLFLKSIFKKDFKGLKKQFLNFLFLLNLLISKNKRIVFGIAPYDWRLIFLNKILKNHTVYYHTSWVKWNRKFYPKKLFANLALIEFWENFLRNKVKYIFSVSEYTKKEIIRNLRIEPQKINVVYHSYEDDIFSYSDRELGNRFLFVGRLEKEKGLDEILEFFIDNRKYNLTIVGDGKLKSVVIDISNKYPNIIYKGFISNKKELAFIYNNHDYLLLNSKKTDYWEELFGMVIIEAMACGVIPIATKHKGPLEIIINNKTGFLIEEKNFIKFLQNFDFDNKEVLEKIKFNCIKYSKKFSVRNISKKWKKVLE
ncbi:glycosyltransferase family 4 protein [Caminibacter mediatlanticus TB-2]|uniref:Glycosyl transferase family 1 n=1 Tax=Caminibacter mediatlanticus TB-2 TaxID=391592 RepID=A0AAI9F0Z4_9BACT|nr:glycosyltransferase family 4 protein [Caminibacter mediatlanticus]EDM23177.1 putative glycosyl transferase family 1 [Caminibacter mediatlanticus TB-2]QCT93941.1 glycosyltransferase family 4 protein [Caminibacter mediatlanticus TB-2]